MRFQRRFHSLVAGTRIDRPKNEWIITEMPDLRIVDQETWNTVNQWIHSGRVGKVKKGGPNRTYFGGLMKGTYCGGSIVAINATQYGCAAHKDRGTAACPGISFPRESTDKTLLGIIQNEILSGASIRRIESKAKKMIAERPRRESQKAKLTPLVRLEQMDKEISRLVDAIAAVGISDALKEKLQKAETERKNLLSMQNEKPADVIVNFDEVSKRIKKYAMNWKEALDDVQQARKILSDLMGKIEIKVKDDGIYAEYDNAAERLLSCDGAYIPVVAGAGFEPTTFGL